MNLKAYLFGERSLARAITVNVIGLAVFAQTVEFLVQKNVLPQFEVPRTFYELFLFVVVFAVFLCFDLMVWRCADNARYQITKFLGKLYATKSLLFFVLVICIWVYKS